MKVHYAPRALRHLREISAYLRERNPAAARDVGRRIRKAVSFLADFPDVGHDGVLSGTREFVVRGLPHIIVYRREFGDTGAITILAVYHGAQLRPGQTLPEDD